jgi:phosphatidate cytidylyltransferase
LWLAEDPDYGRITLFWLLGVVWATDCGAYVAGRVIGGPLLAPIISPRKTWAGVAGGLVSAAAIGAGAAIWAKVGEPAGLIFASVALSIAAQGGDLLESAVKRHFEVKDSGAIIPGHGGLFDRLDGLLAAAPVLAAAYLVAGGGEFLWR